MKAPLCLVIDDEIQLRRLLRTLLEGEGYRVLEAGSGEEGLVHAAQHRPELVVLDLGLPDMDGLSVLKRLREWCAAPVLVCSVRDSSGDKVAALDLGADDYVTKPFDGPEFCARLRAARRRHEAPGNTPLLEIGPLRMDLSDRRVWCRSKEVALSPTEYELLRLLARHAGRVLTHSQILREVWGQGSQEQSQYLRVYVSHLREKLGLSAHETPCIRNEPGIGYRLMLE
jgi:two-component system KDP operon response regulator KdpE